MAQPLVSVITATRNGQRYLPATLASIARQTMADFEHIVVDDCSDDDTPRLLAAVSDPRLRVVQAERPLGPAGALNLALAHARGAYIAVIDHDDLAAPTRLARQVAFLSRRPEVGVLGTAVRYVDAEGRPIRTQRNPTAPALVRWALPIYCSVTHSSAMLRRPLLEQAGGYSLQHPYLADYELFTRLARSTELANLPQALTSYRLSPGQASKTYYQRQLGQVLLLRYAEARRLLGGPVSLQTVAAMDLARRGQPLDSLAAVADVAALLDRLAAACLRAEPAGSATRRGVRAEVALWLASLAAANRAHRGPAVHLALRALALDPALPLRPRAWEALLRHERWRCEGAAGDGDHQAPRRQ